MRSARDLVGVLVIVLASSGYVVASSVCKVVDPETGVTSFSECASAGSDAVEVNVKPVNTVQSSDITRGKGFQSSSAVSKTSKIEQVNKAKSNVQTAKEKLAAAKAVQPGDRVSTRNGSRLSEAYFERVKEAEAEYKATVRP